MIYYFSGTGNSAWVAEEIAKGTGDVAAPLAPLLRRGETPPPVGAGQALGIVFPVYCWAPPPAVLAWAAGLKPAAGAYVFAVCTMGLSAGDALRVLSRRARLSAGWTIAMPANYALLYNREPTRVIQAKIAAARARLPAICAAVRERRAEFAPPENLLARANSWLLAPFFRHLTTDRLFRVSNACTGCGRCAAVCPLGNVEMADGRPRWRHHCQHCMACLQRCPARAIDFWRLTQKRQRYAFEEFNRGAEGEGR